MTIYPAMSNRIAVLKREEGLDRPLGLSHPGVTAALQRTYENPCVAGRN